MDAVALQPSFYKQSVIGSDNVPGDEVGLDMELLIIPSLPLSQCHFCFLDIHEVVEGCHLHHVEIGWTYLEGELDLTVGGKEVTLVQHIQVRFSYQNLEVPTCCVCSPGDKAEVDGPGYVHLASFVLGVVVTTLPSTLEPTMERADLANCFNMGSAAFTKLMKRLCLRWRLIPP